MSIKVRNAIDITVVLIIILLIVLFFLLYFIPQKLARPAFEITMSDADGLIVGSPVTMHGKEVGHVIKLKFDDNQARITFVFENTDVKNIPPNSEINIKSSGIAGSRSIDIYQNSYKQEQNLVIKEPIRQVKSNNVQVAIARNVINAANSMTSVLPDEKLYEIKKLTKDEQITVTIISILNKFIKAEENIHNNMDTSKLKEINEKLERVNNANKDK